MRRVTRAFVLAAFLSLAATACGSTPLPTTSARGFPLGDLTVQHDGHSVLQLTVEIADTPARQEKGLMGVHSLAADQGMAFVFANPVQLGFWMKDTLIPLDIAFWDASERIVDVQHMVPCTADPCTVYYPAGSYSAAVEAKAGALAAAGVRQGDVVRLARRGPAAASQSSTP